MAKKVYVGLSGGVDSSVAAALLKQQGYEVTGVYMKNWSQDLPGFACPWKADYRDAKRVAVQLGIPFKLYDFETQYRQKVVDCMIAEYQAGRTPNPDITCNQEVKFKLFLDTAIEDGADLIATGHYARVNDGQLLTAVDANKDQTYFLYRITDKALQKTLFPLGGLTKPEVRALAEKFGLVTADKKESMGICFVGKVGIKEFLQQYVTSRPGKVIDQNDQAVGVHDGAIFYTIGQRHGLNIGGGLPYYVTGKDMSKNEVYVTANLDDTSLWSKQLSLANMHWINKKPEYRIPNNEYRNSNQKFKIRNSRFAIRIRHRAPLVKVRRFSQQSGNWTLELEDEVRSITPGQSAVLYDNDLVLGGGVVV